MFAFVLTIAVSIASAQPPAGLAKPGDVFGNRISKNDAITLDLLSKKLKDSTRFTGTVTGKITEVCSTKGCWMIMELLDKTKMQVKFKDYAFFVSMDLVGKTVVIDGMARQKIVSVNELKHLVEDAKKPQAEIDAITKPEKQVKFEASGVLVL